MTTANELHPRIKNGTFTDRTFTPSPLTFTANDINHGGGYDDVQVNENGTTSYTKSGLGHRENGFAVEYKNGGGYYMLDGEFVHEPADGELGLELRYVTDGTQYWSTEDNGHSVEAVRDTDFTLTFYHDGELSRYGDPAIIRADGTEEWWVDGVHHPGATADAGTGSDDGQYNTRVGSKFAGGYVDAAAVAKNVRADLKIAQAAGVIPAGATFSVTTSKYSGGQAINIEVKGMKDEDVYVQDEIRGRMYSPKTKKMLGRLQKIAEAYGRSTTDIMTDYFNVSYYAQVNVQDEWSAAYDAAEKDKARVKRAAKAANA